MDISIFGLGYVGTANAIFLTLMGHGVTGVDIKPWKVNAINKGHSPVLSEKFDDKVFKAIKEGLLKATVNAKSAVLDSDMSLICVGTPQGRNGGVDLTMITRVTKHVGQALKEKDDYHLIVIRSTIPPGTTRKVIVPLLEKNSNKKVTKDFGVCVNPEFLRESHLIDDCIHPKVVVIGELDKKSGDFLEKIYSGIDAELFRVDFEVAELVKYVFNAFHALKVSFINEFANICSLSNVDPFIISKILCADHKLNISPAYLKPGFAFGGTCLPKDLHEIIHYSKENKYPPRLLESIFLVNDYMINKALKLIRKILATGLKNKKIAWIGVAYKENTDDVRSSPSLSLVNELLREKAKIKLFDPMASKILPPELKCRVEICDYLSDVFKDTELCVISLKYVTTAEVRKYKNLMKEQNILDLVGIKNYEELKHDAKINYVGLNW